MVTTNEAATEIPAAVAETVQSACARLIEEALALPSRDRAELTEAAARIYNEAAALYVATAPSAPNPNPTKGETT